MDKVTISALGQMKLASQKIAAVTSYDFTTTKIANDAGLDVVLVGDSLGMVKLGYSSTLPVTVEDILYHTNIVSRGNSRSLLVADMPFLSYQASISEAITNAGRLLKAGAEAVKLEGGQEIAPVVRALRSIGIPVMGHIGMTPQSVHQFSGYKVQGREAHTRRKLLADAKAVERAGAFSLVIECVPASLGRQISKSIRIPTIGIGAGPGCDGQILVIDDLLGLTAAPYPRFVKRYADLRGIIRRSMLAYAKEVRDGAFPNKTQSYSS